MKLLKENKTLNEEKKSRSEIKSDYEKALKYANKINKPVVFGYLKSGRDKDFYSFEPREYKAGEEDKEFRKTYSANVILTAYPDKIEENKKGKRNMKLIKEDIDEKEIHVFTQVDDDRIDNYGPMITDDEIWFEPLRKGGMGIVVSGNNKFNSFGEDELIDIIIQGDSEEDILSKLKEKTGVEYETTEIRGYSQGDWNDIYYPVGTSDKVLNAIENEYFGKYDIYDDGEEFVVIYHDDAWEGANRIKEVISEWTGYPVETIKIRKFDGYERTPKYVDESCKRKPKKKLKEDVDTDEEMRKIAQAYKEDIDKIEDLEQAFDYINEQLDYDFRVNSRHQYESAKIWVGLGGPNVCLDTEDATIKVYWGGKKYEEGYSYDKNELLDDAMREIYNMDLNESFKPKHLKPVK